MSRRVTVVAKAFYCGTDDDRVWAVAEVIEALDRCGGNVSRASHDLCISRRHLYRIIWAASLWGAVDAARLRWVKENIRKVPDWVERTRRELQR